MTLPDTLKLDTQAGSLSSVRRALAQINEQFAAVRMSLASGEFNVATINATLTTIQADLDTAEASVADHETRITTLEGTSGVTVISGDGDPDNTTLPPLSVYLNETGSTGTYGDVFVSGAADGGGVYDIWLITTTKHDEFTEP